MIEPPTPPFTPDIEQPYDHLQILGNEVNSGVNLEGENEPRLAKIHSSEATQEPRQLCDNESTISRGTVTTQHSLETEETRSYGATDTVLVAWIDLQHVPSASAYKAALLRGTFIDVGANRRLDARRCKETLKNKSGCKDLDVFSTNEMDLSGTALQRPNNQYHARLWQFEGVNEHSSALAPAQTRFSEKEIDPDW